MPVAGTGGQTWGHRCRRATHRGMPGEMRRAEGSLRGSRLLLLGAMGEFGSPRVLGCSQQVPVASSESIPGVPQRERERSLSVALGQPVLREAGEEAWAGCGARVPEILRSAQGPSESAKGHPAPSQARRGLRALTGALRSLETRSHRPNVSPQRPQRASPPPGSDWPQEAPPAPL